MWRGKLPHWRADDVRYYVTFRHRRELNESERHVLFSQILRGEGRQLDLLVLCVMPKESEMIFEVGTDAEFSDFIEKAKTKAAKKIMKVTGERFPPLYNESFDRIVRDDDEFEERWMEIVHRPEEQELGPADDYATLYLKS